MKLAGKSIRAWSLLAVAALVALFVVPLAAQAGGGEREFDADLKPVPHKAAAVGGSHVTGDVDFEVKGRKVTIEGLPDYGPINISLTTRGDTSPASGLAVERFPVANKGGKLNYERTFTIGKNFPRGVARNLERFQVVVHGIDANDNDKYDFGSLGKSDLDPSLPQEATIPAACGVTSHEH
jgi:hypothetical protein